MDALSDGQNEKDMLLCALFEIAWAKYEVEKSVRTVAEIYGWVRDEIEEVFAAGDNHEEQESESGDVLCMSILAYLWENKYRTSD